VLQQIADGEINPRELPESAELLTLMALIESPQVCLPKIPTCERLSA
jgi:hypothetical protein